MFSLSKILDTIGGHGVGGVCSHIKAFGLSHSPHRSEFCTKGLLGQDSLTMLGRTLLADVSTTADSNLACCFGLVGLIGPHQCSAVDTEAGHEL